MGLSFQQLEQIDLQAGWPAALVPTAAAVQMAESSGNPSAVNASSGAAGLFQIHPAQPGSLDPLTNARQALAKFQTQGWGAWEAYTNGAYQQFLAAAQAAFGGLASLPAAAAGAPGQTVSGAITGAGHGLANASSATISNLAAFFKNQIVALVVGLAIVLVLFGGPK